jgi:hypothetical protein
VVIASRVPAIVVATTCMDATVLDLDLRLERRT